MMTKVSRSPLSYPASFAALPWRPSRSFLAAALAVGLPVVTHAQDAKAIVSAAVATELKADREDHSAFQYRDHDVTPDHDTLYYIVETPAGNLRKILEEHGRPATPDEQHADEVRVQALLNDPAAQARARKDAAHDDGQAEQMLRLLPTAFVWTLSSQSGDVATLDFKPDPNFSPGTFDAESKVLGAMGGQVTVTRSPGDKDDRISSIKGTLLNDVTFGLGIFGRLRKGGSFEVQRREIAPGHWQMTDSHVHINGHALFFKSIGSDEDETRTDFKPSHAKTLQQASEILKEIH